MTMNFGYHFDMNHFEQFGAAYLLTAAHHTLDEATFAIAASMPSVSNTGTRGKRGTLRNTGKAVTYLAARLAWAEGRQFIGCNDRDFFAAYAAIEPGYIASTKQNHLSGLKAAGLILTHKASRQAPEFATLTDAGVAWVKSINADLGKLAKAYSETAYQKAVKADARALRDAARSAKLEGNGTPVDVEPVDEADSDVAELVTADQVEAMQQAEVDHTN